MADSAPSAILVVDDDAETRAMLAELLEDAGYIVQSAQDGAVALALLRADPSRFGLVLLDLMMPLVDGWLFRRTQLADPAIAAIPVVAFSASTVVRSRGLPQGIDRDNFLPKPADIDSVLAVVARHFASPPSWRDQQPAPNANAAPARLRRTINVHWVSTPNEVWVCVVAMYRGIVLPRRMTWYARVENGGNVIPADVLFTTLDEAKAWVEQMIADLLEESAGA